MPNELIDKIAEIIQDAGEDGCERGPAEVAASKIVALLPTWQPIETAPYDTPILVFGYWERWGHGPTPRMAVWERDSRYKGDALEFFSKEINGDVIRWMPLPESPS
jgi:hypothetical protein